MPTKSRILLIVAVLALGASCLDVDGLGENQGRVYRAFTWVEADVLALRQVFQYDDECGPQAGFRHEVVRVDPSGSEAVLFRLPRAGERAYEPYLAAAADGERLVVSDGQDFIVLDTYGDELRRFSASRYDAVTLSADGGQAALVDLGAPASAGDATMQLVTLPDGEPRDLMPQGLHPAFSPDGSQLAFWMDVGGGLYVIDVNGRDPVKLTAGGTTGEGLPVPPFVWAEDAGAIYYREDGALFRVEVAESGDNARVLTFMNEPARAEVSPDGTQVLIDDEFGGFKVLDLDDGTEIMHQAGDYLCG